MGDPTRGLHEKFTISRNDGTDARGGKHYNCEYFVLDLSHDPHALAALLAYAKSCEAEYPLLAQDLRLVLASGPGVNTAAAVRPQTDTPDQALSVESLLDDDDFAIIREEALSEPEVKSPHRSGSRPLRGATEKSGASKEAQQRDLKTSGAEPSGSLSACARCHTYEEALRAIELPLRLAAQHLSHVHGLPDSHTEAAKDAVDAARAVLASSEREKGEGIGGSAAARSAGDS